MYKWKSTEELYIALESSYAKGVVIMMSIDKAVSLNKKLIKKTEWELTFGFIMEYLYQNLMHLMLSWWESNKFYDNCSISKYGIHIIRTSFGYSKSYSSSFWSRCLVQKNYTGPIRVKRANFTPILGPVHKNEKSSITK